MGLEISLFIFFYDIDVLRKRKIIEITSDYLGGELKKKAKKKTPPSSYDTMPYYFPTEQVDIFKETKTNRQLRRKRRKTK